MNATLLTKSSDDALVAQAQRHDESALVELWRRHTGVTRNVLLRITDNWEDAEDALQEAYIKSHLNLGLFDGRSKFSTWFIKIAVNNALMILRKRRRRNELHIKDEDEQTREPDFLDHSEDVETHCIRREAAEQLMIAIRNLRPGLRHILEMKQESELSMREIASATGLSVPAVKSRLLRARILLRKTLDPRSSGCQSDNDHRNNAGTSALPRSQYPKMVFGAFHCVGDRRLKDGPILKAHSEGTL
jgi:RNA polymerase sigma factor (sigma-70 family)